jgi:hypothetical protein
MDEELVLLTSYFNLANGRRQDTADTFRVDPSLPSRTSPDGTAAVYVVTESSTGGHMGPRARRLAADTVAWEYSSHGDEPPAARLRAALRAAHQEVLREFDGHVSVGLSVIAVEYDAVYLGQAAPAQVYVMHEGSLHSISATADGTSPFARALGATAGPEISVFRDKIGANDVLALCSSWYHRTADADSLRDCFGAGTADDIAACLFDLGRQHGLRDASVIIIEAVHGSELAQADREGAGGSFSEQVDQAVQALAGVGRMIWTELRGQPLTRNGGHANARVPELDEELEPIAPAARPAPPPRRQSAVEESTAPVSQPAWVEPVPSEPWSGAALNTWDAAAPPSEVPADEQPRARDQATEEFPVEPSEGAIPASSQTELDTWDQDEPSRPFSARAREPVSDLDRVNSRLQADADMSDIIPPVQAFPDTSTEPERIYATSKDIQGANKRPRRFGGLARGDSGGGASVLRPGLQDIDLRQPMARQAPPWMIWGGLAAIGVLFVLAVVIFVHNRHSPKTVPPYAAEAAAQIQRISTALTPAQQDAAIKKAGRDIRLAQENGTPPPRIRQLQTQLEASREVAYRISIEKAPLVAADFSKIPGAQPAQLAAAPSSTAGGPTTLYVQDPAKKVVYSVTGTSSPTQIIQAGEQDSGFTIGTPTQLTNAGSTALILDDSNTLVNYQNGNKTAQSLQPKSSAEKIVQMINIGSDVYVLDVNGSQVWKYGGAAFGTSAPVQGFFSGTTPNISQAASFVMDDKSMYILNQDGSVLKFNLGTAKSQPFAVQIRSGLAQINKPVYIFTDAGLKYVWIADPKNRRIIQLDKQGGYDRIYWSGNNQMDLSQVKALAVPPGGKTIYVLAGQKLFSFPTQP